MVSVYTLTINMCFRCVHASLLSSKQHCTQYSGCPTLLNQACMQARQWCRWWRMEEHAFSML
jgi:hypothetical protein